MTWYARQLFVENVPRAREVLRADARLDGHVFDVESLARFEQVKREPFAIVLGGRGEEPETTYRDVVLRPAFPADGLIVVREIVEADSHATEWFGDDALERLDGIELAKEIATRCECTTCMFSIDFWGGDCDDARAFVYSRGVEHTYLCDEEGTVTAKSSERAGVRTIVGGDVLTLALLHFDVLLKSGYFLPHTRCFPWDDFRMG